MNKYPQRKKCPNCNKILFYYKSAGGYICHSCTNMRGDNFNRELKPEKSKTGKRRANHEGK